MERYAPTEMLSFRNSSEQIGKSQLAQFDYLPDVNNQYGLYEGAVRISFDDNRNTLLPTEAFAQSPNNSPGEKRSERRR